MYNYSNRKVNLNGLKKELEAYRKQNIEILEDLANSDNERMEFENSNNNYNICYNNNNEYNSNEENDYDSNYENNQYMEQKPNYRNENNYDLQSEALNNPLSIRTLGDTKYTIEDYRNNDENLNLDEQRFKNEENVEDTKDENIIQNKYSNNKQYNYNNSNNNIQYPPNSSNSKNRRGIQRKYPPQSYKGVNYNNYMNNDKPIYSYETPEKNTQNFNNRNIIDSNNNNIIYSNNKENNQENDYNDYNSNANNYMSNEYIQQDRINNDSNNDNNYDSNNYESEKPDSQYYNSNNQIDINNNNQNFKMSKNSNTINEQNQINSSNLLEPEELTFQPSINKDHITQIKNTHEKMLQKYITQIAQLKNKIETLKAENNEIKNKLNDQEIKRNELNEKEKEKEKNQLETNTLLTKIKDIYKCNNNNELVEKIKNMSDNVSEKINLNKSRDEFIEKIKKLYIELSQTNESYDKIDDGIILKWIKHLIYTDNKLKEEKIQNTRLLEDAKINRTQHTKYFKEIMSELKVNNLDELKNYITKLSLGYNVIKKRENKLKKVLLENPNKTGN